MFSPIERLGKRLAAKLFRLATRMLQRVLRLGALAAVVSAVMMVLDVALLGDKERGSKP